MFFLKSKLNLKEYLGRNLVQVGPKNEFEIDFVSSKLPSNYIEEISLCILLYTCILSLNQPIVTRKTRNIPLL